MGFGIAALFFLVMALMSVVVVIIRQITARRSLPVTADWIKELSTDQYQPMLSLLDCADLEALRAKPGFTPRIEFEWRARRCATFQKYLRSLNVDFQRVCAAIKLFMLHSKHDRPDLAFVLVHSQVQFACGMMLAQFRVFLFRWGLASVDVADLVKVFDSMRRQLRTLVPATVANFA